jgi:uncharacterized protein
MVILLLAFLAVALVGTAVFLARYQTRSHRQPIVRTPADYGMEYENVSFKSTDGLNIKGWFIPGASRNKVTIMTHPFPFNRHGFLSKNQGFPPILKVDVDTLTTAKALNEEGYSVLMFDFRNHGQSDKGVTGVGLTECQDVIGAIDYVKSRKDLESPEIAFVSFCMGANATIVALSRLASEEGPSGERLKDVKCLVGIQPVSPSVFTSQYIKSNFTSLALAIVPLTERFCLMMGGFKFDEMSPIPYAKDVNVPALIIQAREDKWTTQSDTQSIFDAIPEPKELVWLEGPMHRFDTYNYVGDHPEKVLEFLQENF